MLCAMSSQYGVVGCFCVPRWLGSTWNGILKLNSKYIELNWIPIKLKRNGMQIGGESIEKFPNMSMMLKKLI
jgi:hypothetical protein